MTLPSGIPIGGASRVVPPAKEESSGPAPTPTMAPPSIDPPPAPPAQPPELVQYVGTPASVKQETPRAKRQSRPKQPKTAKPKRQAPPNAQLPKGGLPAVRYQINKLIGRPDLVPQPRRKEQLAHDIADWERRLIYLATRPDLQITISVANGKGTASKTNTAVYIGSIIANLTRRSVVLLPTTTATATSTAALMAGIPFESRLTVSQLSALHQAMGSYRDLSAYIPRTDFGLSVVSEETNDTVSVERRYGKRQFLELYQVLHANVDCLILDHGNDNVELDSIVLEAARLSDVMIYPATADKPVTLEILGATISTYLSDLRNEKNVDLANGRTRTEAEIPTRDKASNSVAVISGMKKGEDAEKYRAYVSRHNDEGRIIGSIGFEGSLLGIPFDPYIAHNPVADITKIKPGTYLAYLQLCVTAYEKAAELRGINVRQPPRLPSAAQPELPEKPSPSTSDTSR
jgi:cellulose biosynthesis protein BcsQ